MFYVNLRCATAELNMSCKTYIKLEKQTISQRFNRQRKESNNQKQRLKRAPINKKNYEGFVNDLVLTSYEPKPPRIWCFSF